MVRAWVFGLYVCEGGWESKVLCKMSCKPPPYSWARLQTGSLMQCSIIALPPTRNARTFSIFALSTGCEADGPASPCCPAPPCTVVGGWVLEWAGDGVQGCALGVVTWVGMWSCAWVRARLHPFSAPEQAVPRLHPSPCVHVPSHKHTRRDLSYKVVTPSTLPITQWLARTHRVCHCFCLAWVPTLSKGWRL